MKPQSKAVSIQEARKTLGKEYEHLTDTQIREILTVLHLLARNALGYNGSKKGRTL